MRVTLHETRYKADGQCLLYSNPAPRLWRVLHMDTKHDKQPREVGPQYLSKTELLADLPRYAEEWGF